MDLSTRYHLYLGLTTLYKTDFQLTKKKKSEHNIQSTEAIEREDEY
jgi:hypothetical protein